MNKTYTVNQTELKMLLRRAIRAYKETHAALQGLDLPDFEDEVKEQAIGEVLGEFEYEQAQAAPLTDEDAEETRWWFHRLTRLDVLTMEADQVEPIREQLPRVLALLSQRTDPTEAT